MGRLRTNNNKYRAAIEEYILSCINSEDEKIETPEEKIKHFFYRFNGEYNYVANQRRYPNDQERISQYLMGLPFSFAFTNHDIIKLVENLHNVEKLTDQEVKIVLKGYWLHIAQHLLRLRDKYIKD